MNTSAREWHIYARSARMNAGFKSREKAVETDKIPCCSRKLADYELGKEKPDPEIAATMALLYQNKLMLQIYCKSCPVKDTMNKLSQKGKTCKTLHN